MKYFYTILLTLFAATSFAQDALSPSSKRFSDYYFDSDSQLSAQFRQTACFYTIQKQHRNDTSDCSSAAVSLFKSGGESDGDFLVYEGDGNKDYGISGSGVKDYGKYGILYGKAFYALGKHYDISWNAMRFPELYLPYIITDSTGGDSKFETYCAQGGYAKKIGGWHYGFDFSFYGEQAWRLTDPRVLNNTTFLTFKLSAGKVFDSGNVLWLSAYYTRNKQYLHNRYWRPGEQQRFFVLYGFGLYDNKRSSVSFGVSRMYYINNTGAEISYLSPDFKPWKIAASVNYDFKNMYTEESDIVKLYYTRSHTITPSVSVGYTFGDIEIKIVSLSQIMLRNGVENILERYMTDVANSTYDYRKIAEEQNYKFNNANSNNILRLVYNFDGAKKAGIEFGANIFSRTEQNTKYHYKVNNLNVTPKVKADFSTVSQGGKHSLNVGVMYGRQIAVKNSYDVEIKNSAIPHVDFQTCFAPYAYFAAELDVVAGEFCYQYNLQKFSIGFKVNGLLISGNRIDDVEYNKTIGYNSVCPMVDTRTASHNEKWVNGSVFVKF